MSRRSFCAAVFRSDAFESDHHIDARDIHSGGDIRQTDNLQIPARRIRQFVAVFPVEMWMIIKTGIEITAVAIDHHLIDQTGQTKSAQGIVNRGKADLFPGGLGGGIKPFGCDMPVLPVAHQKLGQRQPLPRRAQIAPCKPGRQPLFHHCYQPFYSHPPYIKGCARQFQTKTRWLAPLRALCVGCYSLDEDNLREGRAGMSGFPTSFDKNDLLKCARSELFGPGNAQLPAPPMLMMDRITEISGDGGEHGKGHVVAEFDITPDLWFFDCHFPGNPIMPGCLGLDGLWQLTGFNLGWRGWQGRGYALGVGEVKLTGMVRPDRKLLTYRVNFTKALQTRRLTMGVADGIVEADGDVIYIVKDMKVALSES